MLQLSHDDVAGGHTAPGQSGPSSSSSSSAGGGNNPATEAVLLHGNFHHHRLAGGGGGGHGVGVGGPPHEWNFAKAFLYSLTVLTTIGKCHPGSLSPHLPDRDSKQERQRERERQCEHCAPLAINFMFPTKRKFVLLQWRRTLVSPVSRHRIHLWTSWHVGTKAPREQNSYAANDR